MQQISISFSSLERLKAEFEANLSRGGVFAAGATGLTEREICEVVLVHPLHGEQLVLEAEAVWVREAEPSKGIAVQLREFGPEVVTRMRAFVDSPGPSADDDAAGDAAFDAGGDAADGAVAESGEADDDGAGDEDGDGDGGGKPPLHVYERLRRLPLAEQHRLARSGRLNERVALEKLHGKNVWEALLQNNSLTAPEVARIAKKGTLPKPLLDQIAGNTAWLGSNIVRRALLANHKLSQAAAQKILGLLNKSELAAVPMQTAYPERVRAAAKRLIKTGRGPTH